LHNLIPKELSHHQRENSQNEVQPMKKGALQLDTVKYSWQKMYGSVSQFFSPLQGVWSQSFSALLSMLLVNLLLLLLISEKTILGQKSISIH